MSELSRNTLVVDNVDFRQLEAQRKCLHRVLHALDFDKPVRKRHRDQLEGLASMLDHWSDERYFREKGRRPEGPHLFAVSITDCSYEQAEQVMRERLGHDEDYGFTYTMNW